MANLEQLYAAAGGSAAETIKRLCGNEDIIKMFLKKFPKDESFTGLVKALGDGETETAFRMAHTLKGIAANLGLQTLYEKSSAVTEFLRAGNADDAKKAMPELEAEYDKTLKLIGELDA